MNTQTFKLNQQQVHELDIIFFAYAKDFVNDDTTQCIDFINNTLTINDNILLILINIMCGHVGNTVYKTEFTDLYSSILDEFTKQDKHNVIQSIMTYGIQQPII